MPPPPALRSTAPTFEIISLVVEGGTEGDPPPPSASLIESAEIGEVSDELGLTFDAADAPPAPSSDVATSSAAIIEILCKFFKSMQFLHFKRRLSSRRN
jgi:hypothetical protein